MLGTTNRGSHRASRSGERARIRPLALLVLPLFALGACNDDDDPVTPQPGIQIGVSPSEVDLAPGESATVTVNVTRTGGFDGTVNVTVEDLPPGLTAEGVTVEAAQTSESILIEADPAVEEGTTSATVTASAAGVSDATATLTITVTDEVPAEGFLLSLEPDSIEVEQGESGEVTVDVERIEPFEGAVTLSAEDVPDEVEVEFDPEVVGEEEDSSTLTVTVGEGADTGEYTILIVGEAEEEETREVELVLEVVEPGS